MIYSKTVRSDQFWPEIARRMKSLQIDMAEKSLNLNLGTVYELNVRFKIVHFIEDGKKFSSISFDIEEAKIRG